jgi:hypothetical protein
MNEILTEFKVGLATQLEKQGSSIEEFEQFLTDGNTDKAVEKLAGILSDIGGLGEKVIGGVGHALVEAPQMALALSLLAGTLGGGALYAADSHMNKQDARLGEKKTEVDRLKNITGRLKQDYNING